MQYQKLHQRFEISRIDPKKEYQRLILQHKGINAPNESDGFTPLHVAVLRTKNYPYLRTVNLLLENGADINICNSSGISPLHLALLIGDLETVKLLLRNDLEISKNYGEILLFQKYSKIRSCIIEILLNYKSHFNITPYVYSMVLSFALEQKDNNFFKTILNNYGSFDINHFIPPKLVSSIFHKVAKNGTPEMIEDIIKFGGDINKRNMKGDTPLILAAKSDKPENVRCLLNHGACVDIDDNYGWTALHYLIQTGTNKEVIKIVIQRIIDVNAKGYIDKNTALHLACDSNIHDSSNYEIVKLLVEKGADVDAADHGGMTPLLATSYKGTVQTASYLLKSGANINACCEFGYNALHHAISNDRPLDMIDLLLRNGCKVNARNILSRPPIFHLDKLPPSISYDIIKLFVKYGVNLNATDDTKDTVIHVHYKIGYLMNYGLEHFVELNADLNAVNDDGLIPIRCALDRSENNLTKCGALRSLVAYMVKIKADNNNVSEENLELAKNLPYFREYELEIEMMKKKKIVATSSVCYFDFLTKNEHRLAVLCRNEVIMKVLNSKDYLNEFPLYGSFLKKCIEEGKSRIDLMKKAKIIFKDLKYEFPYCTFNQIFAHLSNWDLKYFVEAFPECFKTENN